MEKLPELIASRSRILTGTVPFADAVPPVNPMSVGGAIPRSRKSLRSTSIMTASTSISGLLLSMSSMIFSAIAIRSGVSRMMIAFIAELWAT